MRTAFLFVLGLSCQDKQTSARPGPDPEEVSALRPVTERLVRASMALRGVRPSLDELQAVHADDTSLDGIIDTWMEDENFGATIRDMHAEQLLLRSDLHEVLPPMGELSGYSYMEMHDGFTEAPLKLIEDVVLSGAPYTDVVTSQTLRVNKTGADIFGLDWTPGEGEWQAATPTDGRPMAGILSDPYLWIRHPSNGNNFHRGRANLVAKSLLCADFLTRDIPLTGEIDLSDDLAVAEALSENADCVSCHQTLDPLGAFWWGWLGRTNANDIANAYADDCGAVSEPGISDLESQAYCYPLDLWHDSVTYHSGGEEVTLEYQYYWQDLGLRPPGYFGLGADQTQLGEYVAADPRFTTCTVKRFYGFLTQTDPDDTPTLTLAELHDAFAESGLNAAQLAKAVVTSDPFTHTALPSGDDRELIGLQMVRSGHYARMLEDLTGLQWRTDANNFGCAEDDPDCLCNPTCIGELDLATTDAFGFRSMGGGMDGYRTTFPTHTMTPTRLMVINRYAAEAAGHVVANDLEDGESLRLLTEVGPDDTDESTVRTQLVTLHLRVLGERVESDSAEIDESWSLFQTALDHHGDAASAWKVVLTAFFQAPQVLYY